MDNYPKSMDQKYNYIFENTCKEVNRVLANWKDSELVITNAETVSMFRTYFAKFTRHEFGYHYYNSLARYDKPRPIVKDGILIGIDLSRSDTQYGGIKKAAIEFNYNNPSLRTSSFKEIAGIRINNLIDYTKLEQFKY